jgi:hypothetical protein
MLRKAMRTRYKQGASVLVLACALAHAPRASAQPRDPIAAEALFRDGRAAAGKQDWPTACAKFEGSLRLDPAVGTVFNLADCKEHVGKLASAWQLFERVVHELPAGDDRLSIAKGRRDALGKRVPRLTLRLGEGAPSGTTVRRDEVELGGASLGTALPVDPGKHVVTIRAPGRKTRTVTIEIGEGDRKEVDVLPGPEGEDEATGSGGGIGKRAIGFVVGGVGVAGLVTGLATGIAVLQKKSTADDHCPNKSCDQTGYDAVQAGRTLGPVTTVMLVVGLAGVSVGTTLVLLGDGKKGEVALVPSVGPRSGGVAMVGRW